MLYCLFVTLLTVNHLLSQGGIFTTGIPCGVSIQKANIVGLLCYENVMTPLSHLSVVNYQSFRAALSNITNPLQG